MVFEFFLTTAEFTEIGVIVDQELFALRPQRRSGEFSSGSILAGEEPTPLMPEDHEKAIRQIPLLAEKKCGGKLLWRRIMSHEDNVIGVIARACHSG